jgi:hypothetical protein
MAPANLCRPLPRRRAVNRQLRYAFARKAWPPRALDSLPGAFPGQKLDEEQLYFVFSGGSANQERQERALFERTASQWADWWEKHWREHVQDVAYSRANLARAKAADRVPTDLQPGTHFRTGSVGGSGHILQSVFDARATAVFHDLDTGRHAGLPQRWRNAQPNGSQLDEIIAWAATEGFDMMGTEYVSSRDGQTRFAIRPIGLRAWELGKERWKMSSSDFTFESLQAEGAPAKELLLHFDRGAGSFDPQATATFLYITRAGTPGLLFVGVEIKDTNIKPGGPITGDSELESSGFFKGRRFGWTSFEESKPANRSK